ncbi:MAG TPA: hypothetical protein VGE52_07545 [Pirellulales bacterium]
MKRFWLVAMLVVLCATAGCRSSRSSCREDVCDPCQRGAGTTAGYAPFEDYAPGEILPPTSGTIMPGPG